MAGSVRHRLFLLVFLLGLAGAPRASPAAAAPVTLDIPVFAGGYGIGFYEDAARRFEGLNPGVKVRIYGDPRIQDKVRIRIIGGDYPDAASVPYILWPALIRAGRVVDLTGALAGPAWNSNGTGNGGAGGGGGTVRWADTFVPGALDSWRIDGRVYGLPFTYACWTLFINRGLFQREGWPEPHTWDEFFALCGRIRAAGVAPVSLPGTRWLYPDAFLRAAYHSAAGERGWAAQAELRPGARTDPRYIRAAAILQRITLEDAQPGWEGETAQGAERVFLEGRAAMTVSGSWLVNEMRDRIPPGFELGALNFPVFADGAGDPTAVQTGADCFFVFNTGDRERERLTVDFLRFLTSRDRAEAFVRLEDGPVAIRGVPVGAYSPRMRETAALLARARTTFNMPQEMLQPPALRQALIDESRLLAAGRITPAEYGERLEAASESDRLQAAHPGRVGGSHRVAGWALVCGMAAAAAWLAGGPRIAARPGAGNGRASRGGPDGRMYSKYEYDGGGLFSRIAPGAAAGFAGPALLLYGLFALLPAAAAFGWAFVRWDGIGAPGWAGLGNFESLLFDSDPFWQALRNNVFLVAVPALLIIPLSLAIAWFLHRGVPGAGAFRGIILFPNMLGGIAAALLWMNAYQSHGGLVNAGLSALGRASGSAWLRSFADYPWLSDRHLYAALVPIYLWMGCGFNVVLFLAAMEGIDADLYEAAALDGASPLRQFLLITLPMIRETVAVSAVFLVIGGLNAFDLVWLLTSQNPSGPVHTLGTLLVTTLFKDFDIGRAAALAVILFALVALGSAVLLRLITRRERTPGEASS